MDELFRDVFEDSRVILVGTQRDYSLNYSAYVIIGEYLMQFVVKLRVCLGRREVVYLCELS